MKKNKGCGILIRLVIGSLPFAGYSQNVGIGFDNPTRALLEVHGASGTGTTNALFGGEHGISFQRSFPAIGFNMYRDANTAGYRGRLMNAGYAAMISLNYLNLGAPTGFVISTYTQGAAGAVLPAGLRNFYMFNSQFKINTSWTDNDFSAALLVGRGTGIDGTAALSGTTFTSFFNFRTPEHTYIRGGKAGSRVFINDLYKGDVIIGNNASRVGVNAPDPQYPFEVRQVNGSGLKIITNRLGTDYSWEWRTGANPTHLYAYYNDAARTSFNNVDGALAAVSDARLKTSVSNLSPLLDKILLLQPVTYEVKDNNPSRFKSTGFIAQEVDKLFPQLVTRQHDSEMLGITYSGFLVIAIKGIQEEQVTLKRIEQRALELEMKLKQLERIPEGGIR
jgi:Chaperone of endosialidase